MLLRQIQIVLLFIHFFLETWSFFRGDRVELLVGRDKGKQGFVCQIFQERNWVIVEGLNCHFRVMGRDKETNFPGIVVKSEAPLLVKIMIASFSSSRNFN